MPSAPVWISLALLGIVSYVVVIAWRTILPALFSQAALRIARIVMLAWLAAAGGLASTGFFLDFSTMPPRFALIVVPMILCVVILPMRPSVGTRLGDIDTRFVGYQTFRLPLELVLLGLVISGSLADHMSFEGRNLDIIMGISAPIIALVLRRGSLPRAVIIGWNILGLALVVNVMVMGILSTPTPFRVFANEPGTIIMASFPYIFIPALLVPMALMGHILSLRQALASRAS